MSFGNKDVLIARFNDNANLFADMDGNKIDEIGSQVSDLIYQFTGITPPDDPENAPPMLRGVWCDIVLFKFIPYQKGIADEEKSRRQNLNSNAMDLLIKIQNGTIIMKNSLGVNIVTGTVPLQIVGTKRITGVL
jgi:hypothetical protein